MCDITVWLMLYGPHKPHTQATQFHSKSKFHERKSYSYSVTNMDISNMYNTSVYTPGYNVYVDEVKNAPIFINLMCFFYVNPPHCVFNITCVMLDSDMCNKECWWR